MKFNSTRFVLALTLALSSCTQTQTSPLRLQQPPRPFVSLASIDPSISLDLRYAGSNNFVGKPIPGYDEAVCLLTYSAATALAEVQLELQPRGMALVVYDCYRPLQAVDFFVSWAGDRADTKMKETYYPNVDKAKLLEEGYIARQSSHSRGSTVDVGLLQRGSDGNWHPLNMGTKFDFFDPRSAIDAKQITTMQRAHRVLLSNAMEKRGFRNFPREWWHYTLYDEPYPGGYFNAPVREPAPTPAAVEPGAAPAPAESGAN